MGAKGTRNHFARVSVLAFLILGAYGVARPVCESLFLEAHGSGALPWAWLCVAAASAVLVAVHQRASSSGDVASVLAWTAGVSTVVLFAILALHAAGAPGAAAFALYVWKDVHVVLLVEGLWTSANLVFRVETARWAYGLFCAAGSLGDLSGSLLAGRLEAAFGVLPALAVAGVLLLLVSGAAALFRRVAPVGEPADQAATTHAGSLAAAPRAPLWKTSRAVLGRSPVLASIIVMIFTVQVTITLVDFLFNQTAEGAFPVPVERTQFLGDVYAAVAVSALLLQFSAGLVLKFWGAPRTLLTVPGVLVALLAAVVAAPALALMVVLKVASKAFDYSLYRSAKEVIYIPLDYEEKTHGKALGDMLAYRVAKAGASLLLAGLVALGWIGAAPALALGVGMLWVAAAALLVHRHRARTAA